MTYEEVHRRQLRVMDLTAITLCMELGIPLVVFNLKVPGNIARVLSRLHNDPTPIDSTAGLAILWSRAELLVKAAKSPRTLNGALMELGQRICRTGTPACRECPVQTFCRAEDPASLPVKSKQTTITEVTERVFFHRTDAGRSTGPTEIPRCAPRPTSPTRSTAISNKRATP